MALDLSALDLSVLDDVPRGALAANQIGIVLTLPLDKVEEDPGQPRQIFSLPELEQLADSIRERGVQTPIVVRPSAAGGAMHRIVHGARRYRASKLAGSVTIPAIIQADKDSDMAVINHVIATLEHIGYDNILFAVKNK